MRDGADHSAKANRVDLPNGQVVGYYTMLVDYDPQTDTFNNRHLHPIPASQVDLIAEFDAVRGAVNAVAGAEIV